MWSVYSMFFLLNVFSDGKNSIVEKSTEMKSIAGGNIVFVFSGATSDLTQFLRKASKQNEIHHFHVGLKI